LIRTQDRKEKESDMRVQPRRGNGGALPFGMPEVSNAKGGIKEEGRSYGDEHSEAVGGGNGNVKYTLEFIKATRRMEE
jgi:hypothetical protein